MKEVKHTPGPWKALPCRLTPDRGAVFVEGQQGWDESPVCSTYENSDRETNEANARLIAAAPELLEMCKGYRLVLELLARDMASITPNAAQKELACLNSIIAKAKGGAA